MSEPKDHHSMNNAEASTHGKECRCEDMNAAAPSTHGTKATVHGTMNEAAPSTHEREGK